MSLLLLSSSTAVVAVVVAAAVAAAFILLWILFYLLMANVCEALLYCRQALHSDDDTYMVCLFLLLPGTRNRLLV